MDRRGDFRRCYRLDPQDFLLTGAALADEAGDEEKRKAVEKVLGEPIFDDFSDNTLKIRRNLLVAAFLVVVYKLNGLSVGADASVAGVKIVGLTNQVVDQTMFWVVAYLVVHFGWNSITHFQQWRLRITGTRLVHQTGAKWASDKADHPDDPRQSTLYTWWLVQAKQLASNSQTPDAIMSSSRIPVSLERFDRWFKLFQSNQLARWLVIEWGLPLFLGAWACWLAWPFGRLLP